MWYMEKIKESDIQLSICEYLATRNVLFWRQNTIGMFDPTKGVMRKMPKFSMTGIPDIIVLKNNFIGLEVKAPKGKQSPNQVIFEQRCKRAGCEYHIVCSIDDVQKLGL